MLVTLLGIVTEVRLVHLEKAPVGGPIYPFLIVIISPSNFIVPTPFLNV